MTFIFWMSVTVGIIMMVAFFGTTQKISRWDGPLIKKLIAAGVPPRECDRLLSRGGHWQSQKRLMSLREIQFMQGLLRQVDQNRWYLCPQVRVADIVQLAPHIPARTKTWWTLFNMVVKWHCDVVIVDRNTFEIVLAVELDDASHLRKDRIRRDILLEEVMQQARVKLLRHRDAKTLQDMIQQFLTNKCHAVIQTKPSHEPEKKNDDRADKTGPR